MPRLTIAFLLVFLLTIPAVFANEDLSIFHQQGYVKEPEPIGKDSFYAKKVPMPSIAEDYFGFSIGAGFVNLKPEISVYKNGVFEDEVKDKDRAAIYLLMPGLYYGYGVNYKHFYIAGELSAFYNSLSKSVKQELAGGHKTEMKFSMPAMASFDIRPGYINEARSFILYGRAGIGVGWVKLKLKDSFEDLDEGASKIKLNYRLGGGFEYFFNKTFSMRLEYIYTRIKANDIVKYTKSKVYRYVCGSGNMGIHTLNFGFSIH